MGRPAPYVRTVISIAGCSLLAVPFAVSFAVPASAVPIAQCTKLSSATPVVIAGVPTRKATLAGCIPLSATGGSGISVTNLKTMVAKTTWSGGKGTTIAKVMYKPAVKANKCPPGSNLFVMVGKVTGGSGAALKTIKVGHALSARVCVTAKSAHTLEPGSGLRLNVTTTPPTTTTTGVTTTTTAPVTPPQTTTTRPATTTTTAPPTTTTAPTTTTTQPPTTTTTTTAPGANNPPAPVPLPAGLSACPAAANTTMIGLVNRDRQLTGNLPPLTQNANLDWAARKHSIMMASTGNMTHNGWDTEIAESHFVAGPPGWTGQNIAWNTGGYAPDWIESMFFNETPPNDGHRLNILSTNFHQIGIGCIVNNSTGAYWWTQDFGS